MAGQILVNTDQVAHIASNIESLNKKLSEQLSSSQTTVKNLVNTWEGEAAQATVNSFNEFATKYFQNYYSIIDNYVKFLRANVDNDYVKTETVNTSLADVFK